MRIVCGFHKIRTQDFTEIVRSRTGSLPLRNITLDPLWFLISKLNFLLWYTRFAHS